MSPKSVNNSTALTSSSVGACVLVRMGSSRPTTPSVVVAGRGTLEVSSVSFTPLLTGVDWVELKIMHTANRNNIKEVTLHILISELLQSMIKDPGMIKIIQ